MWRRLLPLYLFAILTAFPAAAAADQVILANGDRVTGTVASLGGATLTVGTPHGQLRIAWAGMLRLGFARGRKAPTEHLIGAVAKW